MPSASRSAWYFHVPGAGSQRQRGVVAVAAGVSANGIALMADAAALRVSVFELGAARRLMEKSPCERLSAPRSAGAG